jgi:hypothetical protein
VAADRDIIAMNFAASVKQAMAMMRERDVAKRDLVESQTQRTEALEVQKKMLLQVR